MVGVLNICPTYGMQSRRMIGDRLCSLHSSGIVRSLHGLGHWVIRVRILSEKIMPYSVQQRCSYPGCNELVRDGRCAAHPYADRHDSDTQSSIQQQALEADA